MTTTARLAGGIGAVYFIDAIAGTEEERRARPYVVLFDKCLYWKGLRFRTGVTLTIPMASFLYRGILRPRIRLLSYWKEETR